jgi:hypothetical protein
VPLPDNQFSMTNSLCSCLDRQLNSRDD